MLDDDSSVSRVRSSTITAAVSWPASVPLAAGSCDDQAKPYLGGVEIEQIVVAFSPPARGDVIAEIAYRSLLGIWPDSGPHRDPSTDFLVQIRLGSAPVGLAEAGYATRRADRPPRTHDR